MGEGEHFGVILAFRGLSGWKTASQRHEARSSDRRERRRSLRGEPAEQLGRCLALALCRLAIGILLLDHEFAERMQIAA